MKFVLASRNKNKIKEIKAVMVSCGMENVEILSLDDIGYSGEIEETGTTFEENAMIKASVPAKYGYIGVADDSGLEVTSLNGAPGVYSARFAGEPCNDDNKNKKLIQKMKEIGSDDKTAHYVSVIALVDPDKPENNFTVRGTCEGEIIDIPRGYDGFGYDPHFYIPDLKKTYAEITMEEKNAISHRGKSMRLFAAKLKELYPDD